MADIVEIRRLNKYVQQSLIAILSQPGVEVRFIGDNNTLKILISEHYTGCGPIEKANPHVLSVNKDGKKVYEYKYSKDTVSVYVGETCVANVESPALGNGDIQELKDALIEKIIQDRKAKQIEFARKNMLYYDIRAIEELKQFQK